MNDSNPDNRWYVTTAIPYVNARPHIGFAFEAILTDALARYHRQRANRRLRASFRRRSAQVRPAVRYHSSAPRARIMRCCGVSSVRA